MPRAQGVSDATKKNYKGGWLDPQLRAANGRMGFSPKPRPWAPTSNQWEGRPPATLDHESHVTAADGSRFEVCPGCGAWTGKAIVIETLADRTFEVHRDYAKRGCNCEVAAVCDDQPSEDPAA